MMSSLETAVFQRGDVVFAEGDNVEESPYMYIVGSGKVRRLPHVMGRRKLSAWEYVPVAFTRWGRRVDWVD